MVSYWENFKRLQGWSTGNEGSQGLPGVAFRLAHRERRGASYQLSGRMAEGGTWKGGGVKRESENGRGGADTLLSELTALKLKLEKVMEYDFKAQEQARLRKEIFLARLSVSDFWGSNKIWR